MSAPFRPAWWLPGPHAQTIGGRFLRARLEVPLRRERLELADGDFLDLDFAEPAPLADTAPVAVLLHGLEGSTRSGYMLATLRALAEHGIRGVGMNFRSCSGVPNRTARFYHAGDTADLEEVLEALARRYPRAPLGAVGFSLGGNVLLKHLGEAEGEGRVQAAVAVSVPFDLAAGAAELERARMGRVYTSYFMRRLLDKAAAKAELLADRCEIERVGRARTLREFDDAATAPLHGFHSAEEYYARSSSAAFLARIRTPTLILHSEDDPFLPTRAVPRQAVAANPALVDGIVPQGGHVGFVGGTPWAPIFWAEREAARFLSRSLPG